jgi:ubiquinone/menaquinone biosynthesis C-methylase UbiE
MDHKAFFSCLQDEVSHRFQGPVRILDLGCGDLTPILPLLESTPLKRYVGIDESDGALTIASERISQLGIAGELVKNDLLIGLQALQETFDLVVASFSLHHLADSMDKLRVLQSAKACLAPNGMFALIDVFCEEDEPRHEYLERWISHADQRYGVLQPEEKQLLFDHVRARDFPVSEETWISLGRQAGFAQVEALLRDEFHLNGILRFSLPA